MMEKLSIVENIDWKATKERFGIPERSLDLVWLSCECGKGKSYTASNALYFYKDKKYICSSCRASERNKNRALGYKRIKEFIVSLNYKVITKEEDFGGRGDSSVEVKCKDCNSVFETFYFRLKQLSSEGEQRGCKRCADIKSTKRTLHFSKKHKKKLRKSALIREKVKRDTTGYSEINKKIFSTKKTNNTWNTSKEEDFIYSLIKTKYPDVLRSVRTKDYPYACDFYIPSTDLFIEYQGTWTHGNKPFNRSNKDEDEFYKKLIEGSARSEYYKGALKTYTKTDVKKRRIAKKNNLNFLELWPSDLKKGKARILNLVERGGLVLKHQKSEMDKEFKKITNRDGCLKSSFFNKIVFSYQRHYFMKERELWNNPVIREQLIKNRKKYLNKDLDSLSINALLNGFKISGIHYGYSSFSPLWIKYFIQEYRVRSIFDPCAGWGHRLLGAAACGVKYTGVDLSPKTCEGLKEIIKDFNLKRCKIYNNEGARFKIKNNYDAVFTCPPYFNTEKYEKGKFKNHKHWIGWLKALAENCLSCNPKYIGIVINERYKKDVLDVFGHKKLKTEYEINMRKSHFKNKNKESLLVFK